MSKSRISSPLNTNHLWSLIFRALGSDWIALVIQAWQLLQKIFTERAIGLYEVLDFEHELELCDAKGEKAVYRKRKTIRFLQNNVLAYYDTAWGDGKLFADYKCSPGVAVDRYRDGYKYRVLISLRQAKQRGDVLPINIERTVHNGFTQKVESNETDINCRTKYLHQIIIFPKTRHCTHISLIERNAGRETPLPLHQAEILPDGRQQISWEISNPKLFETYAFKWTW